MLVTMFDAILNKNILQICHFENAVAYLHHNLYLDKEHCTVKIKA